jgi:3-phenylpropionate/trans-cinnamate dioxygenase ferredoxin reductase subunit
MGSEGETFVIVGANSTGGAAATTLRTEGFEGRVVLIGEEPHPPYERPPLSKEYLRGEATAESTLLRPEPWYGDNAVELLLSTRAVGIDVDRQHVRLEDRDAISYDRLLIATGGRNRRLSVPGHDLQGLHDLRTFEDADRIRQEAERYPGGRAVVVGAGFIGCEVAASLAQMGIQVEVVEIFETTLFRVVGAEVGRVFEDIHTEKGVTFHFRQVVERFEGSQRVEAVVTDKGTRIECDFVVVGIGIQPNTEVVDESPVSAENGIVVDQWCRTTNPTVYSAGDVANHYHPVFGRRVRVEHWDNALKQGAAAARSMIADAEGRQPEPFDDPHWFWSDQFEHNLQYLGFAPEWDELVVRGSMDERNFVAFYMKDGLVKAAVGVNRGREVRRSAGMIKARRRVDPAQLKDENVDLRSLGKEP